MTNSQTDSKEAMTMGLKLIGLAKIGIAPSSRLASAAHARLRDIKGPDGKPMLPLASKVLAEIGGPVPIMPPVERCTSACEELKEYVGNMHRDKYLDSQGMLGGAERPSIH